MAADWNSYQEDVAAFFRELGLDAQTNVTVKGVRTTHDIDVIVKAQHIGFQVTWIVECKHWATKVSKLHVLALREIVSDVGADRGILLCESGFQSGAIEAAALTNVQVTSLNEVRGSTKKDILAMRLREFYDRIESCRERYWDIPKETRIKHGLRQEFSPGFSGFHALNAADDLLRKAFRGAYPIETDVLHSITIPALPKMLASAEELVLALEPLLQEFEARLDAYDTAIGSVPGS